MLRERKDHRISLTRISMLIPATVLVCVVLALVPGRGAPTDTPALSWRCMESIVGGETGCHCDNCHTISDTILECDHFNPPAATVCNLKGCLYNVLLTKGCSPNNGPGADGCDTKQDTSTPLWRQYQYIPAADPDEQDPAQDETCVLKAGAGPTWFVWRKIWYGCDTGSDKVCTAHEISMACEAASCTMTDLDHTEPRGYWYVCGC